MFGKAENTLRLVSRTAKVREKRYFSAPLSDDAPMDAKETTKMLESFMSEDYSEDRKPREVGILISLVFFIIMMLIIIPVHFEALDIEKKDELILTVAGGYPVPMARTEKKIERKVEKRTIPQLYPNIEELEFIERDEEELDTSVDWANLTATGNIPSTNFGFGGSGGGPVIGAGAGGQVPEPICIYRVEPDYPAAASRARKNGFVLIEAIIDKKGDVVDIKILQAPAARWGFGEKATEAVAKWKFKPSFYNGVAHAVRITFTVDFNLLF